MSDGMENREAMEAMRERKFRVAGDVVNKATADLPDDQRSAIRRLHAHAAENDLTLSELGKLVRYDETTLHRVFHGKYEGNLPNVVTEITGFFQLYDERSKGRKLAFIETDLARKIWKLCGAALEYQRIGFIFGDTQIGKTEALKKYQADHNHGSTIYVSVPTGGSMSLFLAALARALRISPQQKEKELIRRIFEAFDDRMLLIVDEAHQCLYSKGEARGARTMEFVRELFDARKCGVVICGTNVFRDEMDSGRFAGVLKQMKRRRLVALQLPGSPTAGDLNTIAAAYGLPVAAGESLTLQTEAIREEGLGFWLTLLRMGAKVATQNKTRMGWQHVIRAHAGSKMLEGGSK
jgi:DNA transposition AAA+ family ATPase